MKIKIEKMSEETMKSRGIGSWPVWEKEVSRFPWTYDGAEECYILEGKVTVETDAETVNIVPGDFVTFPAGLSCVWDIKEAIKKHYNFP
ncbi:MAG: cupin domain-containing protein [Spirochaetales bacterium]|nr:cupin domain-containing protein [Spirochaetales bacterium]